MTRSVQLDGGVVASAPQGTYAGSAASNALAFDSTYFISALTGSLGVTGSFLSFDLGKSCLVSTVQLKGAAWADPTGTVFQTATFSVDGSPDNSAWTNIGTFNTSAGGFTDSSAMTANAVYRYIRVTLAAYTINACMFMDQMDVQGGQFFTQAVQATATPVASIQKQTNKQTGSSTNYIANTIPGNSLGLTGDGAVTANAGTGPFGTSDAYKFTTTNNGGVNNGSILSGTVSPNTTYTASVYAKADVSSSITFFLKDQATLVTGLPGTWQNGGAISSGVSVGNGWYRLTCTLTTGTSPTSLRLDIRGAGGGSYFWGVQLEKGAAATPYIPTTTAAVTAINTGTNRQVPSATLTRQAQPAGLKSSTALVSTLSRLATKIMQAPTSPLSSLKRSISRSLSSSVATVPSVLKLTSKRVSFRVNYLPQSTPAALGWNNFGPISATTNTSDVTDPLGGNTATKLSCTATGSTTATVYSSLTTPGGVTETASIYGKAGTGSWLFLGSGIGGNAYFNLSTGTVGTVTPGYTAAITAAGGGWYRCSVTGVSTGGTQNYGNNVCNGDNTLNTTSGQAVYTWGAQVEDGDTPLALIATTGTSLFVALSAAVISSLVRLAQPIMKSNIAPVASLIKQTNKLVYRRNFCWNSASIGNDNNPWSQIAYGSASSPVVTKNYATAPDGTNTASRCQFASGTDRCELQHNYGVPASLGRLVFSIWLKSNTGSNYTLRVGTYDSRAIVTVTPTWQRFYWSSATPNQYGEFGLFSGETSTTADVLAWGAQSEQGSTPTDYIPVGNVGLNVPAVPPATDPITALSRSTVHIVQASAAVIATSVKTLSVPLTSAIIVAATIGKLPIKRIQASAPGMATLIRRVSKPLSATAIVSATLTAFEYIKNFARGIFGRGSGANIDGGI